MLQHGSRSLINLQVLNLGGTRERKYTNYYGGHDNHYGNIHNNKRQLAEVGEATEILGGSKGGGSDKQEKQHFAGKKDSGKAAKKDAFAPKSSYKKEPEHNAHMDGKGKQKHMGDKKGKSFEARHLNEGEYVQYVDGRGGNYKMVDGHHAAQLIDGYGNDAAHEHIHEHIHRRDHREHSGHRHGHKHDDSHINEEIHISKREHHDEHHDAGRHDHYEHVEHVHVHRRDLVTSGVPGFVEVASTLFHSNLAKSMAGLIFSKDPNSNSFDFILGTSDSQSTQFYLAPYQDPSLNSSLPFGAVEDDVTNATTIVDPEASAPAYQLRIPVLDSQSLTTNDYCATFDIQPPSPLSMQPCGQVDGFSQIFGYNSTTGELVPVYPASSTQPLPLDAAVKIGSPDTTATDADWNATTSTTAIPTGSIGGDLNATAAWSSFTSFTSFSTSTLSASVPSSTGVGSDDTVSPPPKVSLYFVPSSGFYSNVSLASPFGKTVPCLLESLHPRFPQPDTIDSLTQADNSTVQDISATATATSAIATPTLFTPGGNNNLVSYDGSSDTDDATATDGSDSTIDDSDAYYTTITVTTTADSASPTDAPTYDGNNAVIADTPDSDSLDSSDASDAAPVATPTDAGDDTSS